TRDHPVDGDRDDEGQDVDETLTSDVTPHMFLQVMAAGGRCAPMGARRGPRCVGRIRAAPDPAGTCVRPGPGAPTGRGSRRAGREGWLVRGTRYLYSTGWISARV